MKKKLKTDGVEGLLEIVKAVQNGEDPEEMLKRKEAERLMAEMEAERIAAEKEAAERAARKEAAERAAKEAEEKRAAKEAAKEAKRKAKRTTESAPLADSPKSRPEEDSEESSKRDEFEEQLDSEDAKTPQIGQVLAGALSGLSGLLEGLKSTKKKAPKSRKKEVSESETEGEEDSESQSGEALEKTQEPETKQKATAEEQAAVQPEQHSGENGQIQSEQTAEEMTDSQSEQQNPPEPGEESEPSYEMSEDEKIFERLLERNGISPEEVKAEEAAAAEAAAEQQETPEDTKENGAKKSAGISFAGIRDYALELIDNLKQRGISRKELIMILIGVILAVLVIAFAGKGISSMVAQRQKSENVTADQGLTVTVEKEPQEWSTSYPVELKFKASGGAVKQVAVNGVNYLPNDNGAITVETGEWLLETVVTLEDGTQLNARIEIPKLDNQAPAVNAERSENVITLSAADARSEIKGVYYATVSSYTPWSMPNYQLYEAPLTYTADTLYYFYAEDAAGNRSILTCTTMEQAESVELSTAEMALFPGETRTLRVVTTPENALLKNLRFESTDASIATVDGSGNVTAVAEGIATIKVSVQGADDQAAVSMPCTVTVSRSRSITVSAIGDCTLGTDESFNTMTNFNAFETVNGKSYFFKNVKEILAADDVTFANLEGTFTTETTREMKEYAFKGKPEYTEILQDGSIDVVTLANNHSSDYGEQSLEDTKGYLTAADIDYCMGDTIVMKEVNGIQTAFIGIYVLKDGLGRETQVQETIARAKEQGAQLVIVAFHWGSEKATAPDETQTTLAHLAVDCGANLVVGHHPHVLQGIEKYNGVYIVYSLGNFCFGGNSTPSDMDTMIFQQTFTITEGTVVDDDQIAVVPCSISSTPNYNNYQPTPAQGTEAERIIEKINGYSAVYEQTFAASTGL